MHWLSRQPSAEGRCNSVITIGLLVLWPQAQRRLDKAQYELQLALADASGQRDFLARQLADTQVRALF